MTFRILQQPEEASRPRDLVIVYHLTGELDAKVKDAWPDAIIVNETMEPFKGLYREIGPGKITSIGDVLSRLKLKPEDVRNLILVGFSEGNQGVRTQLLSGVDPSAVVSIDGIHNSPKPGMPRGETVNYHVVPYRQFAQAAGNGERVMIITHSSIQPPDFASVSDLVKEILYPDGELPVPESEMGTTTYHQTSGYSDDSLLVEGYNGQDSAAHVYQATVVLPAKLSQAKAMLRDQHIGFDVGMGKTHAYTMEDIKPWASGAGGSPLVEGGTEETSSSSSSAVWWGLLAAGVLGGAWWWYRSSQKS